MSVEHTAVMHLGTNIVCSAISVTGHWSTPCTETTAVLLVFAAGASRLPDVLVVLEPTICHGTWILQSASIITGVMA